MKTAFLVVVGTAVVIGLFWLWGTIEAKVKESAKTNKGAAKAVAAGQKASAAGDVVAGGLYWILQKGLGLLLLALAIFIFWVGSAPFLLYVAAVAFVAYGIYLLWPGSRSFMIFF